MAIIDGLNIEAKGLTEWERKVAACLDVINDEMEKLQKLSQNVLSFELKVTEATSKDTETWMTENGITFVVSNPDA